MKKLVLLELALLFLATTFQSDNPPGWYQQALPVNDFINDIFFLDSSNGWVVTNSNGGNDTGYIMRTTNGGSHWEIQFITFNRLYAIQFLDSNVGYTVGTAPPGKVYKTTDGGINWYNVSTLSGYPILDLSFANKDTGWICIDDIFDGGVFKTTNGGESWIRQLNETFRPTKLFFLNKDTGWASCNSDRLYRTTSGGLNWSLQFTSAFPIGAIFFLNGQKGWMRGAPDLTGNNASYTTNGGFTWTSSTGNVAAGEDIKFVNDSIGYSGGSFFKIPKSTDGGKTWGYQVNPISSALQTSVLRGNTQLVWGGSNGLIRTTDGGGPIIYVGIKRTETFIPSFELFQNYPNPFNPTTKIKFSVTKPSDIDLKIFSIEGKVTAELFEDEKYETGSYETEINAVDYDLSSGIYFYVMTGKTTDRKEIFIDTKKMILIK